MGFRPLKMDTEVIFAFNKAAREYDDWYEGNALFDAELEAVRRLIHVSPVSLEVGVGTGRFASALEIGYGVDPAFEMLNIAKARGIRCVQAFAEALPFKDASFQQIFFFFTLCFLGDTIHALREAHRILISNGSLIIGFVPKNSKWGNYYRYKKAQGHRLYRYATFLSFEDVKKSLSSVGFRIKRAVSRMLGLPGQSGPNLDILSDKLDITADFIVLYCVPINLDRGYENAKDPFPKDPY